MKRIMLLLLTTLMLAMLFACGTEKTEDVEEATATVKEEEMNNANEPEVELVTREQIVEYYGFSEEELEGIFVDEIINKYNVTEEDLKDFTKESFLECLKFFDEDIKTDIGYLFKGGQPDGKIPVSQIKTVAFLVGENDSDMYWQIRLQDKKAYVCASYCDNMDLEKECDYSGAITDDYIAELLSCLEKANLHKWKPIYEGDDGETTGSWGWQLGIELIDGTVYSWRGWGMFGENQPKEYKSVEDAVKDVYNMCPLKFNEDNEYAIEFYIPKKAK